MPLLREGGIVDDPWQVAADEADLTADAPLLVNLELWRRFRPRLLASDSPLGLSLASDQPPELVANDLDRFALIALEFPKFTDGRPYSYARLLRQRHGFRGELRARGNVLRDQLANLHRCGFDSFEVPDEAITACWLEAFTEISVVYQPAADGAASAPLRRRL
jgi:uncharacterized protein (DUF934 family)